MEEAPLARDPEPPARTLPATDKDAIAYWTWGKDGKLAIYRCAACRSNVHPPTTFCPYCEERDVAPEAVSGRGRVITFTVNHKQCAPDLPVPFVLALVAIVEQPDVRLVGNIVGCPVEDVTFDMDVEVFFEKAEDLWIPLFRPAAPQ